MFRSLLLATLFLIPLSLCAGPLGMPVAAQRPVAILPQLPTCGYVAEVEVHYQGTTHRGGIIVCPDGKVYFERLDKEAQRQALALIEGPPRPTSGWDDRLARSGPVRQSWYRLGPTTVLAEARTSEAVLRVSRHRLIPGR